MRALSVFLVTIFLTTAAFCADREIPFSYRDGLIWLKVSALGKGVPLNFVLDSGAGATVVDLATAHRLGLKFGDVENVAGVHTRATAFQATGFRAEVDGVSLPAKILALDLQRAGEGCHCPIDGLIGTDFFQHRIVQIDFAAQKIRLLDDAPLSAGAEILPVQNRNDAMCVPVAINGVARQWLRLDTGCTTPLQWVVDVRALRKLHAVSIGFAADPALSISTCVQLGATRLGAIKTGIHKSAIFAGEDGLLGNGLLSRFRVTIDARKNRLILETP